MNDKCCINCELLNHRDCPRWWKADTDFTIIQTNWKIRKNSCDEFSPLPDKPGKIEPIFAASLPLGDKEILELVGKINELIAAHNGRDGNE